MLERNSLRVLIAEPLPLIREALAALCRQHPTMTIHVIDQLEDGNATLEALLSQRADVALIDLDLPELHPFEIVRQAREQGSDVKSVLMTNRADRKTVLEALRCGANGILLKAGTTKHLYDALFQVGTGGVFISPLVEIDKIFAVHRNRADQKDPLDLLSTREHQVFMMLVEGLRAKEVAHRLSVSPKTIDTYRASMMRKLDIYDVAGLVKFAIQRNLVTPGQVLAQADPTMEVSAAKSISRTMARSRAAGTEGGAR